MVKLLKLASGLMAAASLLLGGCAALDPLPNAARAGDTVMLVAGWSQDFRRSDVTVTVTGADGNAVVYPPNDPAVRAIINLYPDPASYLVVGSRRGIGGPAYNYGSTYGSTVTNGHTDGDPDWWQTSILLDLPASLAQGTASITVSAAGGETYGPINVDILPGQGSPAPFPMESLGPIAPAQLQSLERADHYTVTFAGGAQLPDSIQVDFSHDPSTTVFAVNPRGELKNLSWSDDGSNLRVLLMPAGEGSDSQINAYGYKYFKFYVSGGVSNLQITSVKAYDSQGVLVPGITASVD